MEDMPSAEKWLCTIGGCMVELQLRSTTSEWPVRRWVSVRRTSCMRAKGSSRGREWSARGGLLATINRPANAIGEVGWTRRLVELHKPPRLLQRRNRGGGGE